MDDLQAASGQATDPFEDPGLYDYANREPRLPEAEDRSADDLDIPTDTRIDMYEMQQTLRQLEKRAYDLFMQNLVKGTPGRHRGGSLHCGAADA